jgi:hypothetical protein
MVNNLTPISDHYPISLLSLLGTRLLTNLADAKAESCNTEVNFSTAVEQIYRKAFYSFHSKYRRKCKIEERKYKQQLCDVFVSDNSLLILDKSSWKRF